jgi:hypothetical protein
MATDPAFAVTPRIGAVSISTAETSLTAPTNVGALITAVAAGTRIAEIVYQNLVLPNASWSIRVTTSIAQATHVTALGADL